MSLRHNNATETSPANARAPQPAAFAVENVSLRRTGKNVLDSVTATFLPGELSVILGPNGAGKSTLLKVFSGAIHADTGSVSLNGQPIKSIPSATLARQRAFLTQDASLAADFSVEEVVLLGRTPHLGSWETAHDHRICEWALDAVEMSSFRERRFLTLSGGEKQRVHLARVLAQLAGEHDNTTPKTPGRMDATTTPAPSHTSRWLLLDEPTSALDLRHQHSVLALVHRFTRELGLGVLAVLHDLNLAMRYADKTVLMHEGKIAAAGPTRDTLTCERISTVYGVRARIFCEPPGTCPFVQTEICNP